jgi:hypothetical protein
MQQFPKHDTYQLIDALPTDDDSLWLWMQAVWGIRIPRTRVCPHHCAPFDAFADAYFARSPVSIWKASRGYGGKSKMLAALAMQEAAFLPAQVVILGGSGAQSLNVHAHTVEMWAMPHAPSALMTEAPTKYDTKLESGAWIRSLMASQTSVRGPHPQRLRLDEIDEMELAILEASQGQPMRGRMGQQKGIETQTVMSSTHQYPDGTMTEMLRRAADRGWPIFEWCYRESMNPVDGWLDQDEVERKRSEIPRHMWETEYDLQEPSFEGRAIDTDCVEAAFDASIAMTDETNWEREPASVSNPLYITGVDWAKEKDRTIIATFDARDNDKWECVAWAAHQRAPWPYMVGQAEERYRSYPPVFAHDATGLGNVIADYFDPDLVRRNRRNFKNVIMSSGRSRHDMFTEYVSAIESGKIVYPRITLAYSEHKYCTLEDLYGKGHPPDSVVAGAIAWSMRGKGRKVAAAPIGIERDSSPWKW